MDKLKPIVFVLFVVGLLSLIGYYMYTDYNRRELEKRSFTFHLLVDNAMPDEVQVLVRDHPVQTVGAFGKKLVTVHAEKDKTYRDVKLPGGLDWYAMDVPLALVSNGRDINRTVVTVYRDADHLVNVGSASCYCFEPRKEYGTAGKSTWKIVWDVHAGPQACDYPCTRREVLKRGTTARGKNYVKYRAPRVYKKKFFIPLIDRSVETGMRCQFDPSASCRNLRFP